MTTITKLLSTSGLFALSALADTWPPVVQGEKIPLPLPDPRLGVACVAEPGSICWIAWEDLFGWGDRDFNDAVMLLEFDSNLGVSFHEIHAGRAYTEFMTAGLATLGAPLPLSLHVTESTGVSRLYFSGPGTTNPDSLPHALVVQQFAQEVPEPRDATMTLLGLLMLFGVRWKKGTTYA